MADTIRVLLVDDESMLLEIGKDFLEDGGEFEVDTLTSAKAALDRLKTDRYDVIVSDYQMPGMDGIAFLKNLKASGNATPFIIFTGRSREEIVIQALNEGAAFYLQKGGQPDAMFAELAHKIVSAVTGRRAEGGLRESEEKFRSLVENALETILILDFQGKILFANNAVTKLVKIADLPGLVGRNVMEFVAPESREDVMKDFARVAQGHDAFLANYQLIGTDGKKITIECIGKRVTYEGRPADLISIRDISERREQEEVIRQKNLMLTTLNDLQREFAELPSKKRVEELAVKKLMDLSGAVVTMFSAYDPKDEVLRVSSITYAPGILASLPGAIEMLTGWLGKRPEDMQMPLGQETYRDINRSVVGIKKTVAEMSYGSISPRVGASIQKLSGIDHFIHIAHVIDGELYGISVMGLKSGQPDPSQELLESFAHIVAVSLRRQRAEAGVAESEERLRSFVAQALEGVSIVDENGRIVEWNPAQEKITGISRADTIGVYAWDLATRMIPDENRRKEIRSRMEESIKLTIKSGISTHPDPIYYTFHRPDGTTAIAKQTVFIVKTSHGHMIGTLNQDVTTEKRADEKIRKSEELLREIIEKNPMSIQIVDRDGFTLTVNPAFMRLFGSVPPPDFSIITDLGKSHPELENLIARVKCGEAVSLPDMRFNPHDLYPELPDVQTRVRAIIFPLNDRNGKPERFVFMHENITGQKMAEEALQGSHRILEAVIDNVPARVFWKDTNLTYLGCNTAFARDAGFEKPGDIIGKDDFSMGWRDQAELYRADDRHVIESGNAKLLIEEPQTTPSGEQISLLTSKVPLRDAAGEIIGVLGTYIDVTERKRASEELKESEISYRGLFNTIRQALYILDREGKFVDVNAGAEKMYGYAREEFIGRTPEFLSAPGKNDLPAVVEKIQKAFAGEPQEFEFWGLRKNGEVFPKTVFLYRGAYFGQDIVLAVGIDISERRLAENALRDSENKFSTVFRSNPVTLTLVSATDGRFIDVNDAFVANTGYSREEVIGRTSGEVGIFPDAREYEQLVTRLRSGQPVKGMELTIRQKSGEARVCQFTSGIVPMQGRPLILSSIEDITDRKSADLAFQAMTRGMVGTTGLGSLDRITESISSWLGADCIMVGEILPDRKSVKVLSMLLDGNKVEDFSYNLAGTPCENTAEKGFCLYPDNAASLFPNSRDMQELTIRGYAGTPLKDADGRTIGILCILTRKPLVLPPDGRKILDIIAVKAAAEIGRKQSEERLTRINEALLDLGTDSRKNIGNLTRLCGELLNADCVLYNRLDEGLLCVIGQWNCPPDLPARDAPEGHICYDVIRKDLVRPLVVCDLQNSRYATSDPNVATYRLKTYIGHPVRYGDVTRGSLCAVYSRDITPTTEDLEIIGILSSAVAQEEERREADLALRESEADFRDFFNNTGDAIVIHDLQGRFLEVNDEICRRLGYTRKELLAMSPGDIDEPEFGRQVQDRLRILQQAGHTVFETIHRRKDGILIPTEVSSRMITYRGKPAIISTGRDITERKRAGEALVRVNQKLSLLSGITRHDIKNQLLGLNGFLAISKKYLGDAAKMSEFITKEENITRTIEQQIAFAREYEAIGVKAPVWQDCRSLVDAAALQVPTGNGIVKNDIPAGLEIFADPLVVKAFYNLIDNAVRHGGKISAIRFSVDNRNGNPVIVCEDDGAGVPADEKEHIFERGFGKNTGLGLFLSREILAITGITMTETGEPGKGARFEMGLPKGAWRNTGEDH